MNINTRHDSKVHLPVIRCQFHTHQTAWCRKGPRPRSHHHGTSIVSAPGHVIASTKTCAVSPGLRLLGRRRRNLITTPRLRKGSCPGPRLDCPIQPVSSAFGGGERGLGERQRLALWSGLALLRDTASLLFAAHGQDSLRMDLGVSSCGFSSQCVIPDEGRGGNAGVSTGSDGLA